jgi:RNA polymerase sigma-70 factor (ECF subfamily)
MTESSARAVLVSEPVPWEFQSAVGALAASRPKELSDALLMTVLATSLSKQSFNSLFEEVFNRYHERVTRWCFRVTKNRDRALDLTQEVFFKAFRSIHTFRGDSQLSTWLYVITRNHCLNAVKKWKSEPDDQGLECALYIVRTTNDNVHLTLERDQTYQHVLRFLVSILTPMEVRVMVLHYVHDLTLPEITRRLMLSNRSGAKSYIVNARRKLKVATRCCSPLRNKLSAWAAEMFASKRSQAA